MTNSKISGFIILLILLSGSIMFVQCTESSDERTGMLEQEREELVGNLEKLRDNMDDELSDLRSRIDDASDEADEGLKEAYAELTDRSDLERTIDEVENTTADAWEHVRDQAHETYSYLSDKFNEWRENGEDLL